MASTNETVKSTEAPATTSSPACVNPFLGTFPPPDPNKPVKKFTPAEIEMALLELTIEAAWENCKAELEEAKTAAKRQEIRHKHMANVFRASQATHSKEALEMVDGRIDLLDWGNEIGAWEEKYWFSRL